MSHCMKSIYDGRTEQTRERITESKESYCLNTVYTNSIYGWKWYVNSKGYFHIVKLARMKLNGKIKYYSIENARLKTDNTLHSEFEGQYFSLTDAIQAYRNYNV